MPSVSSLIDMMRFFGVLNLFASGIVLLWLHRNTTVPFGHYSSWLAIAISSSIQYHSQAPVKKSTVALNGLSWKLSTWVAASR